MLSHVLRPRNSTRKVSKYCLYLHSTYFTYLPAFWISVASLIIFTLPIIPPISACSAVTSSTNVIYYCALFSLPPRFLSIWMDIRLLQRHASLSESPPHHPPTAHSPIRPSNNQPPAPAHSQYHTIPHHHQPPLAPIKTTATYFVVLQ